MAKKEQNYDKLAEQIGDLGGEPREQGLGKLSHKAAYGAKEDLTPKEQEEMTAFLKRQDAMKAKADAIADANEATAPDNPHMTFSDRVDETPIANGWIPLDRKQFGDRGKFYPADWEFYIRPATGMAIKNWISIDEKNALQLNNTFDEIIKLCVKITAPSGNISWRHINLWDRFWLILKVREATFVNNRTAITFEDTCSECNEDLTFELTPNSLHFEFPDDDLVEKHWNAEDMTWDIDPAEYGVPGEEFISLHTPTLEVQQAIIEWAQRQYNRGKKVDEAFSSTYLPWLIDKIIRDEVQMDRRIQKIEKNYRSWSVPFHELMTDIIKNISVNPKETLKKVCPHCGEEVISNVQFPNGVKVLFKTETGVQKFGSRQ